MAEPGATPDPQFKRGPAQAGQLQYGEAQALNQASVGVPTQPAPPPETASPEGGGEPSSPAPTGGGAQTQPVEPNFVPASDTDKFLFGPTARPQEPISAGLSSVGQIAPPPGVADWLPFLSLAAADPGAPEQVRDLHNLVVATLHEVPGA